MQRIVLIVTAMLLMALATGSRAAELLMFEEAGCSYCEQWEKEIGFMFHKTDEAKRAPLRRVNVHGDRPEGVKLTGGVHYTPTFVLVSEGREIGRIEGYPGDHFFWPMLGQILARLPVTEVTKKD